MLYIVSTPIGNLQDITLRALDVLKRVDYILCEDTRHSSKLLTHFEISKPLVSFHLFNERERQDKVLEDLQQGKQIALISDAGTPLIADPGFTLIQECRAHNIPLTSVPGPVALIAALTVSGCSPLPFQFIGFLPKKENELKEFLSNALEYAGTTICYESPNRVHKTLSVLQQIDPDQKVVIARELTKHYETIISGTAAELATQTKELLGEVVLLFEARGNKENVSFSHDLIQKLVQDLVSQGHSVKDSVQHVSTTLKMSRNEVYKLAHLAL